MLTIIVVAFVAFSSLAGCHDCRHEEIPLFDDTGARVAEILIEDHKTTLVWGDVQSVVWFEGAATNHVDAYTAYLPGGIVLAFDRQACANGRGWEAPSLAGDQLAIMCTPLSQVHPNIPERLPSDALAVWWTNPARDQRSNYSLVFDQDGTLLGIWFPPGSTSNLIRTAPTFWRVASHGMPLARMVSMIEGECELTR